MENEPGDGMEKEEILTIYDFIVTDAEADLAFLATSTGLARSSDGGATWTDAFGDLFSGAVMPTTCLAFQKNHQLLFAGVPGGVLKSRDGGTVWEAVRLQEPAPLIVAIAFSPAFSFDRTLFAASAEDGLFCSRNGGASWDAWNFGLLDPNLYSLVVSPHFEHDRSVVIGSSTGIFRSINGGYSWIEVEGPGVDPAALALAIISNQEQDDILFAGFESAGLFSTQNNGRSWVKALGLPEDEPVSRLVSSTDFPGRVVCLAGSRVFCSEDYGVSFFLLDGSATDAVCLQGNWLWLYGEGEIRRIPM